jgi:arylsulfatase A-like enzyme
MNKIAQPNIIICQCDQLRAHAVGCYGDPVASTPNMDRLAREGVRFANAFTNNPVCTPARSCLLSGQYSRTCTGMLGNVEDNPPNPQRVRLCDPTLAEIAAAAGYRTAHFGKWHIDPQPQLVGFQSASYPNYDHKYYGQTYYDEHACSRVVPEFGGDFDARCVTEFLEATRQQPFLLHYNISLPHQPIGAGHMPGQYARLFSRDAVPLRPNTLIDGQPTYDRHWFKIYTSDDYYWDETKRGGYRGPEWLPPDFDLHDLTALYYGATTCVDDLLGRLLADLDRLGLADNTILAFTSDHGDNLGSHGLFNKDVLYEESVRIPLLVRWQAGLKPRLVQDSLAQTIDVMPTLLNLADLPVPDCVQGRTLAPFCRGASPAADDAVFIETDQYHIGIRTATHLYGMQLDTSTRKITNRAMLFYDLRADPYQERNLAGTAEQVDTATRLQARLTAWNEQTQWRQVT